MDTSGLKYHLEIIKDLLLRELEEKKVHIPKRVIRSREENKVMKYDFDYSEVLKNLQAENPVLYHALDELIQSIREINLCIQRLEKTKETSNGKVCQNRGSGILEQDLELDEILSVTKRMTTIDGHKLSFVETSIGENNKIKEASENGELVYRESTMADGMIHTKMDKQLAYIEVDVIGASGIPEKKRMRNPENDVSYQERFDSMSGTSISKRRPILDKDGDFLGEYKEYEKQDTHKIGDESKHRVITTERRCRAKDGSIMTLESVIEEDANGLKREDYVNGQLVANVNLNNNDLEQGELSREDILNSGKLLDSTNVPTQLLELITNDSFEKTGRHNISAIRELDDDNVKKLQNMNKEQGMQRDEK